MTAIPTPNIIFQTGADVSPFPGYHAHIGYQNYLAADMLSGTTGDAGFEMDNLLNELTYDQYRTSTLPAQINIDLQEPKDVSYVGLGAHNLADINGTASIEYSNDAVTYTPAGTFAPGDNNPLMFISQTKILARFWRINFTGTGTLQLGVLYIGEVLVMQRPMWGGITPPQMARRTEYQNNVSDSGQWLGRSVIRKNVDVRVEWEHLTSEWYRANFEPFVKAVRTKPFFLAWNPERFPLEVALVWTTRDIRPVNMGVGDMLSVSIQGEGFSDD